MSNCTVFEKKKMCAHYGMTKPLRLCLLLCLFSLATIFSSKAQLVGGATVKANFGIDADVYANLFQVGSDDWFQNLGLYPGSGLGVIDQSDAVELRGLIEDNNNYSFERRMSVTTPTAPFPFPVVNGYLWIDGVYGRDNNSAQSNTDQTIFTSTSDKNSDNPATWNIGSGSVPQKGDIIDVMAHLRGEGPKMPTEIDPRPFTTLWAFGAATLRATSGSKHIDFEFFRNLVGVSGNMFTNTGNDGGHTAWQFDDNGSIEVPGDIIISVDYEGGGTLPDVRIRVWMSEADYNFLLTNPASRPFNVISGSFSQGLNAEPYGYVRINALTDATPNIFAKVNTEGSTLATPWGTLEGENAALSDNFSQYQFVEIGINLTAFGLDKRGSEDPCANILGTLIVKTRSCAGGNNDPFTCELKDFAGPYAFGNVVQPAVTAAKSNDINCTVTSATITATDVAPPGATIKWYAPDGDDAGSDPDLIPGDNDQDPDRVVSPDVTTEYTVVVEVPGFMGCTATSSVTVNVDKTPPPSPTLAKQDPTCTIATGCVTVTSSTTGLQFSIDGGAYAAYPAEGWCGLSAGEHCVSVKSANGCTSQACITIPVQPPTPDAPDLGKVDPTCTTATGCVTVTSSTANLEFSIDGGEFAAYPVNGWCLLNPGQHCVRARNAQGCISDPTCITIPAQPPTPDAPTLAKTDPTCTVATGCVTVTSSTANLEFSIDGGEFAAYPANGWCGLSSGQHCVRARNAQGCISDPGCITIPVQPNTPPVPTLGKVDPTCTEATGCVTVTSSTAGLEFSLDDGTFAAYPANGWCGLAPGEHCVRARNAAGCISQNCITISVQPPTPDAPDLSKVDPTCTVATGCVSVTSSTAGLQFSVNGGDFADYPAGGWCELDPGEYCIRAMNEQGCISDPACITVPAQPSTPDAPTLAKTDPDCEVSGGCITITSSTTGLTFSVNGEEFKEYPANGWCGLSPGEYCIRAKNEAGCISDPTCATINPAPSCNANCTYTQGYYGNTNGNSCDGDDGTVYNNPIDLIVAAMAGNDLVVGGNGNTITIPGTHDGAVNLNSVMPGNKAPAELKHAGDCNIMNACFDQYLSGGKINNVLLSQTIALGLNMGISGPLGGFGLKAGTIATAMPEGGCGSTTPKTRVCGYWNGDLWVPTANEYTYRTITASVINALTNGGYSLTVAGLYALANDALGNKDLVLKSERGASLSDINNAVDAINNAFDQCRVFIGWDIAPCPTQSALLLITSRSTDLNVDRVQVNSLRISAYPNPVVDQLNIRLVSPVTDMATIDIYSLSGVKVASLRKAVQAHIPATITYRPGLLKGGFFIQARIRSEKASVKAIRPY